MPDNRLQVSVQIGASVFVLAMLPGLALAEDAPVAAATAALAPVSVEGQANNRHTVTPPLRNSVSDSAAALNETPGGALVNNGGISGEVAFRGMSSYRNQTHIDGMGVTSGGPNWMDPPLHYAPAALVESLSVTRGIPSVADSIDSIGTTVNAKTRTGGYGNDADYQSHGFLSSTVRSVDNGHSVAGGAWLANQSSRLGLTGATDHASDRRTPYGRIRASSYGRDQVGVNFAHRNQYGETSGFVRRQSTGDTGNPDLPLDVHFFRTWLAELKNVTTLGETTLTSQVDFNHVEHEMDNYILRPAPDFSPLNGSKDDPRFIRARSQGYSVKLAAEHPLFDGTLSGGFDGRWAQHDAFVGNPDMPAFGADPFDSVRRDYYSTFGQWKGGLGGPYSGEIGVRYTHVVTNAGPGGVAASLPKPAQNLAGEFAARNRRKTDDNVDVVAKLARSLGSQWSVQGAIARRTRSPYYLERYGYIPLQATAGLADGNNYVGNINLKPEVAYEADLGLTFTGDRLSFSPNVYYHRINHYITGVAYDASPGTIDSDVERVSRVNGDPTPLRYANVEAEIYGADMAAGYRLSNAWQLNGGASYTRGKRTDTNDDLYRISPARLRLGVVYDHADWRLSARERYVFQQHHIAQSHLDAKVGSPRTGGYALTDVSAQYRATEHVSLTVGIDNLFNRRYRDFMSGYNRAGGSSSPLGSRLPGAGRNAYATLEASF